MKAILVGVYFKNVNNDLDYSLHELKKLATPLGYEVVYSVRQNKEKPDPNTYIGKGKVEELKGLLIDYEADTVIFDDPLSPSQNRNLELLLGCKVIDRSFLILEIFLRRAKTNEAKLEIKLARDKYLLSRISLNYLNDDREGGGSAFNNKGSGETKRELDRRHLLDEINRLENELKEIRKRKINQIERRKKNEVPVVSLVGYTNAGKSSTLNSLLEYTNTNNPKKVYEKDELFATLDTFSREISYNNLKFIVTDTVGFVSKLPTTLINSFYHTLEEVKESDLLIYVIDISSPYALIEFEITNQVIREIGADKIPFILLFTKIDKGNPKTNLPLEALKYISQTQKTKSIYNEYVCTFINNKNKDGVQNLLEGIYKKLSLGFIHLALNVPYSDGKTINIIEEKTNVITKTYLNDYIYYEVFTNEKLYPSLAKYEMDSIVS